MIISLGPCSAPLMLLFSSIVNKPQKSYSDRIMLSLEKTQGAMNRNGEYSV